MSKPEEPTAVVVKTEVMVKADRVLRELRESDIEATVESLVIRDVKEYLLVAEYRQRKLEKAKSAARTALKEDCVPYPIK